MRMIYSPDVSEGVQFHEVTGFIVMVWQHGIQIERQIQVLLPENFEPTRSPFPSYIQIGRFNFFAMSNLDDTICDGPEQGLHNSLNFRSLTRL